MKPDRCASRILGALAFVVTTAASGVSHAVPPEYLHGIALHPSDPQVFAVRYEGAFGGLLFSRDGGKSLQVVPGQTFYRYDLRGFVPMQFTNEGKFLLALDSGLRIDDGKGCGLSTSDPALDGLWIAGMAAHPSEPDTTFFVTTGDTKGKHSGVWRRKQGMVTSLGMSEPVPAMPGKYTFIPTGLKVVARPASSEGVRLIEAGTAYDHATTPATTAPVLRVSDNLGMSWTSHPIPDPNKTGGNPRILLVDGSDAFKALVSLENGFGDEADDPIDPIFITKDGAQTFAPYLDKVQVAGEVALLPSGQVLIADSGRPGGLWSASSLDAAPTKIGDDSVRCLAYQPKTQKLFMCKLSELGYYDVATNSYCEIFRPGDTSGFVSCPDTPLEKNADGIRQLCGGLCGAAHYASAPVCSMFTVPPLTSLCGPAAHAYDNDSPDPEKRWIEPPGANGSPRCTGFSGPLDAGVSALDGGASASDAGFDAASSSEAGAGEQQADGGEPQQEPAEDAGTSPNPAKSDAKKSGGCNLVHADPTTGVSLLGAVALVLGFGARRRRRSASR